MYVYRMKMSKFKIAVLVVLAVTVIYTVALYQDIQRYEAWKQSYLESHSNLAPWIDFAPYITTNLYAGFSALILMLCWSVLFICVRRGRNAQNN